ncbi:hypothetical protein PHMEG_00016672 [Phytophthora megakarya]|uniref:Uncharacterized protein n=1 Tax=Phytophthora megakarya TaxID=4795 RepID=A0A225VZT4_9STRA|nr:hypothetical protein PHMEG_00016672 [Phytophthora megakarya]
MGRHLPTRKALAGHLPTQEFERKRHNVIARLQNEQTVALVLDGLSCLNKEDMANYVLISPLMRFVH